MADDLKGYSSEEVLNKVLNTSNDSLKVDVVSGAEYAEDSSHTDADTGNFVLGVRNDTLAALGGTDGDYVPFQMNSSGALFIDVADGGQLDTIIDTLETTLTAIETDQAAIEVLLGTIDSDTDAIKTSVQLLDNAVDGNYLNVNMNLAGSDAQAGEGTISATTQRVTIATDDDGVAHLATIAGAVSTQMQVDVVASLPAGSAAIGKLAANSGVDIGDVDVTSLPASTNTIEVVGDAAENANAAGNPLLIGGRYDASGTNDGGLRTLDTTDVGALALDPKGVLLTKDFTGQAGSILVTGTGAVAAGYGKFVAIQFLEDTVFNSGANGLSASDVNRWPDDTGAGSDISSNGAAIDSVTFPQGMTIFGRWDDFTLASGKVIAYIGYV